MWRNWSGYVSSAQATLFAPATMDELIGVLRGAEQASVPVRVVGAGHSFSPLVQTDGVILSLDKLQGVLDVDKALRIARIHGGTRLSAISAALAGHGLAMENLGDINVQSIAGATSTGTHGTGIALGNLATQMASFTLVAADGSEVVASPAENTDLFEGGRIGLGVLGVLTEISLRLVPSFKLKLQRAKRDFDECLSEVDALVRQHRSFELYWLPHTNTVMTKTWNVTEDPLDPRHWRRYITEQVFENSVFGFLCGLGKRMPFLCPAISRFCASLISPDQQIDASHSLLSTARRVRFNEMEWSVPAAQGPDVLREIREFISRKAFALMFPLECRWVRGDDIWLSPSYGRDSVHISVHQYRGMPHEQYFKGVQAICMNHGGRPHWGKVHSLTARDLSKIYPRWNDFLALRERMDPRGRFLTPYLRKLFGL